MPFLNSDPETVANLAEDANTTTAFAADTLMPASPLDANITILEANTSSDVWTVRTLYPLVGSYFLLVSGLFLFYFIRDWGKNKKNGGGGGTPAVKGTTTSKEGNSAKVVKRPLVEVVVVGLLAILFFLYVGLEVAYGTFLTVFSVKCKLGRYLCGGR